jgi:hypothetical protein
LAPRQGRETALSPWPTHEGGHRRAAIHACAAQAVARAAPERISASGIIGQCRGYPISARGRATSRVDARTHSLHPQEVHRQQLVKRPILVIAPGLRARIRHECKVPTSAYPHGPDKNCCIAESFSLVPILTADIANPMAWKLDAVRYRAIACVKCLNNPMLPIRSTA